MRSSEMDRTSDLSSSIMQSAMTSSAPEATHTASEAAQVSSSDDDRSVMTGEVSPGVSSPGTSIDVLSKKITWGKAKSYPGSETVSDLDEERTSDIRSGGWQNARNPMNLFLKAGQRVKKPDSATKLLSRSSHRDTRDKRMHK
ncbi:unnamed protein product, partial [Ixodes hexagonus]